MLSALRGQFGASVLNVGGTDVGLAGEIPEEVSFGWAFRPRLPSITSLLLAVEFRDALAKLSDDKSYIKRTHYGAEFGVFPMDKSTNLLTLRAGYNASALSYGVELALWHSFSLQYVVYSEEYGEAAGQDLRERKMLHFNVVGF